MSFREKTVWAQLIATLYIWGRYSWWFWSQALDPHTLSVQDFSIRAGVAFGVAVFFSLLVSVIAAVVNRFSTRAADRRLRDEREYLIDLRATRWAFGVVTVLVIGIAFAAFWFGHYFTGNYENPQADAVRVADWPTTLRMANGVVLLANALWSCVLIGHLARYIGQLTLLRRGL